MEFSLQHALNEMTLFTVHKKFNHRTKNIDLLEYLMKLLNKFYKKYCDYLDEHFKCNKQDCLTNAERYVFKIEKSDRLQYVLYIGDSGKHFLYDDVLVGLCF